MARFQGTVRRSDLEGGHWQLRADDGTTYELAGNGGLALRDGLRVEVVGKVERGTMSISMTGPRLAVSSARAL